MADPIIKLHVKGKNMEPLKKIIRHPIIWLGILMLALAGCGNPTPESPAEAVEEKASELQLAGTAWELESIGEPEDNIGVIEGSHPTLNMMVDRYVGFGGCNWFLGVYGVSDDTLRFQMPASTPLLCDEPPGVMNQEGTYMTALLNVTEFQKEGDKLIAYTVENQRLLTFIPAKPMPFENTTWTLKLFKQEENWIPVVLGSEVTAQFEGEQLSGSAGCNDYSATVDQEGTKLTLTSITASAETCTEPEGLMAQEEIYLAALETVAGYQQVGVSLALLNGAGQPVLLFGAQAANAP
ncbi:MAG TPA: META domain-containing protein [Anaerolineae bacterium]|nr:META domain-containing protein [Anaerolineae bacterium]